MDDRQPNAGGGDPLLALRREMNRLFEDVARSVGLAIPADRQAGGGAAPRIDAVESEDAVRVTAELPGVADGDVDVTLDGDLLTISGEKRAAESDRQRGAYLAERSYGAFARSIRLPFRPDAEGVEALLRDGVLTVTLRRPAGSQPKVRRITVRAGASEDGPGDPDWSDKPSPTTAAAPDLGPTG